MAMARRVTWFFARHWIFSGLALVGLAVLTAWLVFPAEAHNMVAQRWQGQYGGGRIESAEVVRTQDQWQQLWQRLDRKPPGELQTGRQIAVFVSGGERSQAGYRLRLVSASQRDDRLMIVWQAEAPDPMQASNRVSAQVVTEPWMVVLIDRADLAPIIEQRVR
jgi:hypothetical protein